VSSALAYSLRDLGFDAHSIRADLPAVKTAALAHPPGLVLLDLDLGSSPDGEPLEGIDLIAPLRAQGWTVLMITGTASLDRIADAIAQGAASWIVKGATFDGLVHAVLEIMRARDPQL
jgi:two-component system, NarL family, nitrate/nitrite response regulator NarL